MLSSSSSNAWLCGCGRPVRMWMTWTLKNPGRRFLGCTNYNDEYINCGFFCWIDPQLPNKWYREKIYELRAQGNRKDVILDASPPPPPPPPDAPVNFHVNETPNQVVIQDTNEHGNGL
ncbi:unnamed protein product [Lactuca virosa]|uniref:GRF-type domain-containing protein n=1 Tax=Lactuca virosa TaxID=75947 RepID=A0AAU9LIT1_9ASTR|nr:unnamed protein product [Lactuca virosa]